MFGIKSSLHVASIMVNFTSKTKPPYGVAVKIETAKNKGVLTHLESNCSWQLPESVHMYLSTVDFFFFI